MAGSCVQVDPPCVEFKDVKIGYAYKTTVTVKNVGKSQKSIIMEAPRIKMFKFTAAYLSKVVAPGLSVTGLLEFTPEEEVEVRDCLLIHIDQVETIKIPLLVFPRACHLHMDAEVDFGVVTASSQLIRKDHPITNEGSAPGTFQVQYSGDPSVRISPCSGVIAPGATQWLKVKLRTDRPKLIMEKALVTLQNDSAVLTIGATVVDQQFELFDQQGTPLSLLRFGPVHLGTSQVQNVVLRNSAPQACDWVCLLQDTAAGTEVGTDLQKSTNAALLEGIQQCSRATPDVSQVVVCVPKQGRLGPYDKTTVAVRFSPIFRSDDKKQDFSASQQDFCLFLQFESIRSRHGFTHLNGTSSVELAVTGSGLPVSLVPSPSHTFSFPSCVIGQHVSRLCVLQNFCSQLPINFHFRKLAHFTTEPSAGTIGPGQRQHVILTFTPRQQGKFQVHQKLDVVGHVVSQREDNTVEAATTLRLGNFHSISLHLSAECCSLTTHPVPKLNPGITPEITNPTGLLPQVRASDLAQCRCMVHAAVLNADKTRLHTHHRETRNPSTEGEELLAFPNDRAISIRPASPHPRYRTIFTGVHRYCYVDPAYAFTEEEEEQRERHRQIYTDFIAKLRQRRLKRTEERQQEVEDDIGIVPSQGLVPPKLCISHIRPKNNTAFALKYNASLVTKSSCLQDMRTSRQASVAINAVPSTSQEVADCDKTLTAQELYQVDVGPHFVDFGEVCVQSVCVKKLELMNHLPACVWVQLEVDCPELQGSSPLSHVLPPGSRNTVSLAFQSNELGHFYRPVCYSVNQKHPGQILVQARVVPIDLELSTTQLTIRPTPNLLIGSEYRSSVTLRNQHNQPVEFTWRPVVTESGILFSVRPAAGTVEPFKELDCEVVWYPSFLSPSEGDFDLCVVDGRTQRLHCTAQVGTTKVLLTANQLMFGSVALNMASVRTAILYNNGKNHAYYQVLDVCPLPGMIVSPAGGEVPSGGQATLKIHFSPDTVMKFDTRVEIALRNMKPLELRVGGSVEMPNLDISVASFKFYEVHVGSKRVIPFTLTNRSSAAAWVSFDLSEYTDFSVHVRQPSESMQSHTMQYFTWDQKKEASVSVVEVQGLKTVDCLLVLTPTQLASYDFDLPLTINGVRWPADSSSPSHSSSPSSAYPSLSPGHRSRITKPPPHSVTMVTQQPRHIQATVLCAPVEMSPANLQFHVEPDAQQPDSYTKAVELKAVSEESVCWRSFLGSSVYWWFDTSPSMEPEGDRGEGELCTMSPSSGCLGPGQSISLSVTIRAKAVPRSRESRLSLSLYLVDEGRRTMEEQRGHQPYRQLSITITTQLPSITSHPPQILLPPVPLKGSATASLTLLVSGYPSGTSVVAEVSEVVLEDGTKINPISVDFPEGNTIPAHNQRRPHCIQNQEVGGSSLTCRVSFCCSVSVSVCTYITFMDHLNNKFRVNLCAIADNCLLTVWPYLALHGNNEQVVLKTGPTAVEAVLQRYHTPSPPSGLSSSSSLFDHKSSAINSSLSDSFPCSESMSSQLSSHEKVSPITDNLPTNLAVPEFPAVDTKETQYYRKVLLAVERWFSLCGWPSGPRPISVPHTLRRSVVDMIRHLSGKEIPNIPQCQSFSSDTHQRIKQLLQQHEAVLAFLRSQGACLHHIRPEYLLDEQEFNLWCTQQSNEDSPTQDYSRITKRSWTDVLLQIYKVLVLYRLSESSLDTTLSQEEANEILNVTSQPLASNIYSSQELLLLSWLNKHYESMRKTVWSTGGVPSARWIVNFDLDLTDGLVLAAVLAAYCPYLVCVHLQRMYITTRSLEQILHNNIIVVQALTSLSLNIDIQPTDLSDPNAVQMLMLCVHLYEKLPQYLPVQTVTLSGDMHTTSSKQVHLSNPSSKPAKYQAFLFGEDAHLFSLPNGSTVTVSPKVSAEVTVRFNCSFLRSMEAVLVLASSCLRGTTVAFKLKTCINRVKPTNIVKWSSPCYEPKVIHVPIVNPLSKDAKFTVVLVETTFNPLEPEKERDTNNLLSARKLKLKSASKKTPPDQVPQWASSTPNIVKMISEDKYGEEMEGKSSKRSMYTCGDSSEFLSSAKSVCLMSGQTDTLDIHYLPLYPGTKYCSVLLVCPQVGDMVYMVRATADLPLPSPFTIRPSSNMAPLLNTSADPDGCVSGLRLRCKAGQVWEEVVGLPLINLAWEQALAVWGEHTMGADEHRRRTLTRTLHSSTVRATAAACKLSKEQIQLMTASKRLEYSVEVSLPQFTLPSTVTIPVKADDRVPGDNPADSGCVSVPVRFKADSCGQYPCQVVLRSCFDTRVYLLEALVT
ncbi:cilia and flagella-associated protein 47-like [Aulostomus maculatus]